MLRTQSYLTLGGLALAAIAAIIVAAGVDGAFAAGAIVPFIGAAAIIASARGATSPFGIANAVTLGRLVIVCLFGGYAAVVAKGPAPTPLAATLVAFVGLGVLLLDGVDGWTARRTQTASAFGARFDLEVDAFFILVLALVAWCSGKAGAWVLMSGAARYLYVAAGLWIAPLTRPLFASHRRKIVCVVQVAVLIVLLLPMIASPVSDGLAAAALALTIYSFIADIRHQFTSRGGESLGIAGE